MTRRIHFDRRTLITVLAWLSLGIGLAAAHEEDHPPPRANAAEVYRPTVVPDRIILTFAGEPSTTQAVTWRTSTQVKKALAQIAVAEAGPAFASKAQSVPARTQALKTDLGDAHYHTVQFEGLSPATRYAYRVGDGVNWSEWFQFSTASDKPEPFSFIYFGDAQNDVRSHWSRVIREAHRDAPKARFMIHAGDLINRAEADAEWGEWFSAGGWLNAMVPSLPVPGNHEMASNLLRQRWLSRHWRPQFALPEDGPKGLEETCYTLVYHGVRIIALNSNEQLDVQAAWLDKVLTENRCRWVVCTFHHPIFSTAKNRDNPVLRKTWKPIFDKHRVDLVLQGHDHTYGRTGVETPSEPPPTTGNVPTGLSKVDAETGTVYVVSISGPKMYNVQQQPYFKRTGEKIQLYQIIHVDGDTLRYEARTAHGELYDAFDLKKRPGQINELIERVPAEAGGNAAAAKSEE
jgi:3',5'-cyclic AMP phosphodiesterase CpdA